MGLVSWIVVGLITGLLAKWVMSGSEPGDLIFTILVAVAGASFWGFVIGLLGGTGATDFNAWSILVATIGATIFLFLYGLVTRRTA